MWTWLTGAAGIVAAATLGWFLQQVAGRGIRWRALTLAGHELDIAAKLSPRDPHARALRHRAAKRLEKYLGETSEDQRDLRREHLFNLAVGSFALAYSVTGLVVGGKFLPPWVPGWFEWVFVVSVPISIAMILMSAIGLMRRPPQAPSRPAAGTPPAPPSALAPAARRRAQAGRAPRGPRPPAGRRPTPPT